MICVSDKKAVICKGDFHPAQLYKGDKKIAGYNVEEFESENGVTLENCYNDKVYEAQIHGKNLLDVKMLYPDYANANGGITLHTGQLWEFSTKQKPLQGVFKENTQYIFSFKYNITDATTAIMPQFFYTDGTKNHMYIGNGAQSGTGVGEGETSIVSRKGKTVKSFSFTHGSNINTRFECELSNMQIEEGATATEYEAPLTEATITARGKNLFKYISGGLYNGSIIEQLPNGVIVKGNLNPNAATTYAYSKGWFSPGATDVTAISPFLKIGDIVTISADITLLEIINEDGHGIGFSLTARDKSANYNPPAIQLAVGETRRLSWTIENTKSDAIYYPIFKLNSNVLKIENIQIEYGNEATPFEPYIEPQTIPFENGELTADIPTFRGRTIIEVESEIPATISGKYKKVEV